jgi:hypothetical protein
MHRNAARLCIALLVLEVVLFKPLEGERFPLLVVNHGSTGNVGDFEVFQRDPGLNGHFIINDADRWGSVADAYIDSL